MPRFTRRTALKSFTTGMLGAVMPQIGMQGAASAEAPAKHQSAPKAPDHGKPNVLFITLEGIPLSALSCYGSIINTTPGIDRVAREGMLFETSVTTNALCAPARAVLLTGKYNHLNGMMSNEPSPFGTPTFDPKQPTLPRILQQHGYATGMVGKWHLPCKPGEAGFDYFAYKKGAGGPYYEPTGYRRNEKPGSTSEIETRIEGYVTDVMTDLAIEGMKASKKPFFMMLQYFNDHRPWEPKHEYEHVYDGVRIPEPGTFWDNYSDRAAAVRDARTHVRYLRGIDTPQGLTPKQTMQWNYQRFMRLFLATMRSLDENVARLLRWLDETGLAETTAVFITGDHGFFLGEHGLFDKRLMYEQALRVPQLVRYPKMIKAGTRSTDCIVNIDNASTVLEVCGIAPPDDMQGRSYLPQLRGQQVPDWRRSSYYHYYEFTNPHFVYPHYGVRTDRFKLISYYSVNQWELFDLEKDPDEMENLFEWDGFAPKAGYEDVAQTMLKELSSLRQQYGDTTGPEVKLWPPSRMN